MIDVRLQATEKIEYRAQTARCRFLVTAPRQSLARSCARMPRVLLTIPDRDDFIEKSFFPFVKRVRFENEKRRFEIDDFAILSLLIPGTRVLCPQPWSRLSPPSV